MLACRQAVRSLDAFCREYSTLRGAPCSDPKCGYHLHKRLCPHGEFVKVCTPGALTSTSSGQTSSLHWTDRMPGCGPHKGSSQVKEPEGFNDKSKKRSSRTDLGGAAQRKRTSVDKTRTITDFFKGGASSGIKDQNQSQGPEALASTTNGPSCTARSLDKETACIVQGAVKRKSNFCSCQVKYASRIAISRAVTVLSIADSAAMTRQKCLISICKACLLEEP